VKTSAQYLLIDEPALHRKSDDRYQVTIFDPNGKRIA
jgi:hypothetical protein